MIDKESVVVDQQKLQFEFMISQIREIYKWANTNPKTFRNAKKSIITIFEGGQCFKSSAQLQSSLQDMSKLKTHDQLIEYMKKAIDSPQTTFCIEWNNLQQR